MRAELRQIAPRSSVIIQPNLRPVFPGIPRIAHMMPLRPSVVMHGRARNSQRALHSTPLSPKPKRFLIQDATVKTIENDRLQQELINFHNNAQVQRVENQHRNLAALQLELEADLQEKYNSVEPNYYQQIVQEIKKRDGKWETDHVAFRTTSPRLAEWVADTLRIVTGMRRPEIDSIIASQLKDLEKQAGILRNESGHLIDATGKEIALPPTDKLLALEKLQRQNGIDLKYQITADGRFYPYHFDDLCLRSFDLIAHDISPANIYRNAAQKAFAEHVRSNALPQIKQMPEYIEHLDDKRLSTFVSTVNTEVMKLFTHLYSQPADEALAQYFERCEPDSDSSKALATAARSGINKEKAEMYIQAARLVDEDGEKQWQLSAKYRQKIDKIVAEALSNNGTIANPVLFANLFVKNIMKNQLSLPSLELYELLAKISGPAAAAAVVGASINHLAFDALIAGFGSAEEVHKWEKSFGMKMSAPAVAKMGGLQQGSTVAVRESTKLLDNATKTHNRDVNKFFVEHIERGVTRNSLIDDQIQKGIFLVPQGSEIAKNLKLNIQQFRLLNKYATQECARMHLPKNSHGVFYGKDANNQTILQFFHAKGLHFYFVDNSGQCLETPRFSKNAAKIFQGFKCRFRI